MPQLDDEKLYDVRLIERYIRKGEITREEVSKRLSQLKDMAGDAEVTDLVQMQDEADSARRGRGLNGQNDH